MKLCALVVCSSKFLMLARGLFPNFFWADGGFTKLVTASGVCIRFNLCTENDQEVLQQSFQKPLVYTCINLFFWHLYFRNRCVRCKYLHAMVPAYAKLCVKLILLVNRWHNRVAVF